ncbi:hypothetical protein BT96DRAFT_943945 [Gymnopus androsaceus JB14]|uniref:Uncharacterized protein n=1 Tax=Gymnopus androsaceus JB14 TaxID=1447944 RepID=A0A6A4H5I5_9AGAR|nr:hypothetical protein BT96DRAFT_943945 [Gymnopus androsaceus JB14]
MYWYRRDNPTPVDVRGIIIICQFMTNVPTSIKCATKHLELLILVQLQKEEEHGSSEWPGKPNDLISGLLDEVQGPVDREKLSRGFLQKCSIHHLQDLSTVNKVDIGSNKGSVDLDMATTTEVQDIVIVESTPRSSSC